MVSITTMMFGSGYCHHLSWVPRPFFLWVLGATEGRFGSRSPRKTGSTKMWAPFLSCSVAHVSFFVGGCLTKNGRTVSILLVVWIRPTTKPPGQSAPPRLKQGGPFAHSAVYRMVGYKRAVTERLTVQLAVTWRIEHPRNGLNGF